MDATHKYVPFRGKLVAGGASGATVAFVTAHVEGKPTPLYRYDLDAGTLGSTAPMPAATCGAASSDALFVGGADGGVRRIGLVSGEPQLLGAPFDEAPAAIAVVGENRVAVGVDATLYLLDAKTGARLASYAMPAVGASGVGASGGSGASGKISAIAASADGSWIAVGTTMGTLVALGAEEGEAHTIGDAQKIHEAAIACALFDPDEPRVYTSGLDQRLLLTHVRGALEAEDRAGGPAHEGALHALALGPEDKLYTASQDGTIRTWLRGAGRKRPSTLKDAGRGRVLLVAERQGRAQLVSLGDDQTLRIFPLDAGGKVGERALSVHDVYAWARQELAANETKRREKALHDLAALDDAAAIALLAERAGSDPDHALKVEATSLLGRSGNPRAVAPLEKLVSAPEEKVRLAALSGLRALVGATTLRPLELALQAKQRDVGVVAVEALTELSRSDDEARARLIQALEDEPLEVRQAALRGLEALFSSGSLVKTPSSPAEPPPKPADSPEASRIALRSQRPDVRRLALVRLFERGLLGAPGVSVLLRRHVDDLDPAVRAMAFLVSVASQPALASALRAVDEDLDRRLTELETPDATADGASDAPSAEAKEDGKKPKKAAKKASKKSKKDAAADSSAIDDDALRPLLEALASRAASTCLEGAKALAALEDSRAFGTLLQLSSAAEPAVRVEAAVALARLGDPRAMPRVRQMLRDGAREVRDAALTALVRLEDDDPIRAAEAALEVPHEDARARGLQLVVRATKKAAKDKNSSESERLQSLLARALDDAAVAVRSEAFKSVLSQEVGGGADDTLRFALRSAQADVRRDVLTEVMGRIAEPWAHGLLLELFSDPDPKLRAEAFAFAQKRSKGKSLEPLAAALAAPHPDLKLEAVDALRKRHVDGVRELLVSALDDADARVRLAAIEGLAIDEASDALRTALGSKHADVRARAACGLAELGDGAALATLIALVQAEAPELAEEREAWRDRVVRALGGLGELGVASADVSAKGRAKADATASAEEVVRTASTHREVTIRRAAIAALGWVAREDASRTRLLEALADDDAAVKLEAASSLALLGDRAGLPLLVGSAKQEDVARRGLHAAIALGDADLLASFLDSALDAIRARALMATMMIESSERDGVPDRCIAALSARHPRTRLVAARALEAFADDEAFATWVTELFLERDDERVPWTFPHDAVRALSEALTHGAPTLRVRVARLLEAREDKEPQRLERGWVRLTSRFGADLGVERPKKRAAASSAYAPEEMRRVVAGAYAGLSRHPGGGLDARVRQTAIARLVEVARVDDALRGTVVPIVKMALADREASVRKVAFEALGGLGTPAAELAEEAISVGFADLGIAGLRLLATSAKGDEGTRVLAQTYLTDTGGLEQEAGKLLAESLGWVETFARGLEAKSSAIRDEAVRGLARLHEEPKALDTLRGALRSSFEHVRQGAALELGVLRDASAFEPLVAMLRTRRQNEALAALQKLGDVRATDAWIDRVVDDPAGDALVPALLTAVGRFRRPENATRLLALIDEPRTRKAAFDALITLSGYDQPILDGDHEDPTVVVLRRTRKVAPPLDWQAKQHPRHDAVLASTLDAALRIADTATITRLLPFAQWAKGSELDAVLARVCVSTNDALRDRAVSAYGFRAQQRGADAKTLVEALTHSSARTQLLAAEGLAWTGRKEGARVLLAAVDTMPDLNDRRRAVRALGELADEMALDLLIRLADEEGHALQEDAAEAIGHLARSPSAEKIETLLLRLASAQATGSLASGPLAGVALRALTGLAIFGREKGWAAIRERAKDPNPHVRTHVMELLGRAKDDASRDLLVRTIEDDEVRVVAVEAMRSLRIRDGAESLEPDYVSLRSRFDLDDRALDRLSERGDPARVLACLPAIVDRVRTGWMQASVRLDPVVAYLIAAAPLDAAAAELESPHEAVAAVAASIVGRAGSAATKKHGAKLAAATTTALASWDEGRARLIAGSLDPASLAPRTERLAKMLWAAGQLGVADEVLVAAASRTGDETWMRRIRGEAVQILGRAGKKHAAVLRTALTDRDGRVRELAASALSTISTDEVKSAIGDVLDDRSALSRLLSGGTSTEAVGGSLREASASAHTQGVVLPHLVRLRDVKGLAAIAGDAKASEPTRLGAIEALARITDDAASDALASIAKRDSEDEELRKAAWRALRRWKRAKTPRAPREVTR